MEVKKRISSSKTNDFFSKEIIIKKISQRKSTQIYLSKTVNLRFRL